MKNLKKKLIIKSDVGQYIKKANKTLGKDMNQKKNEIPFKETSQRMWDSFYDKKPS